MSLRRVDDDGASAPSIDAAIGAFANRLPVATRLNHVLAVGAKFRLEQQGKQQQQPQRKPVSTDAYPRAGTYRPNPSSKYWLDKYVSYSSLGATTMSACAFNPSPLFTQHYDAYVAAMNAFGANPVDPTLQWDAIKATMILASISNSYKKTNYLRENDCYIVLNFMVNAMNVTTISHESAYFMMRESLHHDKFSLAPAAGITSQDIANRVIGQCQLSQRYLAPHDQRFACNVANYPALANPLKEVRDTDWKTCSDQNIEDAENAAEAAAAAAVEAAAAQADPNMQPQYQQMAGPGAFQLYQQGAGA